MAYRGHQDTDDLDELLRQADQLLDDEPPRNEKPENDPADDLDYFTRVTNSDSRYYNNYSNNYGRDVRNYQNNYGRPLDPYPQDEEPEEPAAPTIPAYNVDFQRQQGQGRSQSASQRRSGQAEAYRSGYDAPPPRSKPQKFQNPPKKRRKRHGFLKFLLFLLVLLAVLLAVLLVAAALWLHSVLAPPQSDRPIGTRKDGAATVLLCGTDEDGTRTDTMMLLYVNANEKAVNLVSLPRDTLTMTSSGYYAKLNSAYGRNGCDEEGMEGLLDYVEDIIGFRPDGYMLVSLDCFVDVVDVMGGIEFDVPMDMYYEDPSQDLYIDLKEGLQKLDGYDAMGLVRFRKGYDDQDLGRVAVQRQFISACMDQWLKVTSLPKLPKVLSTVSDASVTNLSTGNMLWLALNAWRSGLGDVQTVTLPGYADMLDGVSYYILDPWDVADTVNSTCNPYERDIDAEDLNIVY